ncbi:UNVERIFIED_CONTAM: hypothetical protein GTU68_010624 [Idotea baltica]|nr:hypothetical protein [Idotea baltica]
MAREYLASVQTLFGSLGSGDAVVGGVLSGTSGDGIDVVLTRLGVEDSRVVSCEPLVFEGRPFPAELAPRVRGALDGDDLRAREIALLSRDLGRAFGGAAGDVARAAGLRLDLLGSHGLTIYHHDGVEDSGPASLQIGDGDHVAECAGCVAVSDFRQADLAGGGGGAPISVLADDAVFAGVTRPTAVLNLGGMANISWIGRDTERRAFDTGPAGALLDGFARELLGKPYDAGGAEAARGRVNEDWLREWMSHPFFMEPSPKSTGRDTFGQAWVAQLLTSAGGAARAADLLRTAVELVARSIREELGRGLPAWEGPLWVAGGGVHNACLMGALKGGIPGGATSTAELGVDPDAREALVFAVLAGRCLLGEATTRPEATGARSGKILGKISQPGR